MVILFHSIFLLLVYDTWVRDSNGRLHMYESQVYCLQSKLLLQTWHPYIQLLMWRVLLSILKTLQSLVIFSKPFSCVQISSSHLNQKPRIHFYSIVSLLPHSQFFILIPQHLLSFQYLFFSHFSHHNSKPNYHLFFHYLCDPIRA